MSRLREPIEFGRRNQGDVARASPSNDYNLLLIHNLVEHCGEVRTEAGVGRFTGHGSISLYRFSVRHAGGRRTEP